jgi:ribosomal protein L2
MFYVLKKKDYKFKNEVLENTFYKRLKKNLSIGFSNASGRNVYGRITVLRRGGRLKSKLRIIDWRRILNAEGKLISIEKD